ncbi:hypothetical protein [Priestia megaterium]|uniref:hypothetical protein n=1 Tax=Priestia megaterium TaxID=1404 RepID=UPI0011260187|nr:hypothetical protein [Priestia megaterium]TPF18066.1 hypothetical protein CBE78_02225 [Priestia megaterium]TPF22173.1 hypothetical protein CBE79_04730 [Priestia megaterium]
MHLEKVVKYEGKEYMVSLDLHNEKELKKQTIGLAEEKLIVSARVANSNYKIIYKVEDRISLTNKESLVSFLKDSVKAAYDKENLEQVKELDAWDGDMNPKVKIDYSGINIIGSAIDVKKIVESMKNYEYKYHPPLKESAYELLEDVKIHEYKVKRGKATLIGFNDNIITKVDLDDEKFGEYLVNYNPTKIKLGDQIIYDKALGYIDFTKFTIKN